MALKWGCITGQFSTFAPSIMPGNSPTIKIETSESGLQHRYRRHSNGPVFLVVGVVAVGLILAIVYFASSNRNRKDQAGDQAGDQAQTGKEDAITELHLTKTVFEVVADRGDDISIDVGAAISGGDVSACSIEWDLETSKIPVDVLSAVSISKSLVVDLPGNSLVGFTGSNESPNNLQLKICGRVTAGNASKPLTISIRIAIENSPPSISGPPVVNFDPVLGAQFDLRQSDVESLDIDLETRFGFPEVPNEIDSITKQKLLDSIQSVEFVAGKATFVFSPTIFMSQAFEIFVEVQDKQGLTATQKITFSPSIKSATAKAIGALASKMPNADQLRLSVSKSNALVQTDLTIDRSGKADAIVEFQEQLGRGGVRKSAGLNLTKNRFQKGNLAAICDAKNEELKSVLKLYFGGPAGMPARPDIADSAKPTIADRLPKLDETALALFDAKKLFLSKSFADLVFADVEDFEYENRIILDQKYKDHPGLKDFFEENKGLKAELFSAIDPSVDNLAEALGVFDSLRVEFPKQVIKYKNLAIAISVCWDNPRAIYHFAGHQKRTRAIMPQGLVGANENFKHFVTYENQMQGRAQWLPWEFLVHVINHQTPVKERYWALGQYLSSRVEFGKCYKDVPYDYEMLKTRSQVCKLSGKEYTLSNIRDYGGVCAMQADFSGRVGKSLGVPSEYVSGQSSNGENHAWVMWVEVKNVSKSSIAFSLQSFGRYRGDNYYVGKLRDPKSGKMMTDRQMELRLHTVGTNAYAKRQADLLVKALDMISSKNEFSYVEQLSYLERTIKLCPWHEGAWEKVAGIVANNEIEKKHHRQMNKIINSLFVYFAAFPDFTWTIFDQLVQFVPKEEQKNDYYGRLIQLYVSAKRPDLACEARLKLTDYLLEQKKLPVAMEGLAATIKAFPDEGRYVPRLLDRLESLVGSDKLLLEKLVIFYAEFLPLVPPRRGRTPSKYCIKMYERGIQFFTANGITRLAGEYQQKLAALKE